MRRISKKYIVAGVVVAAAGVTAWGVRAYRIVRPDFPLKTVEIRFLKARYPAHWEDIVMDNPRLGDTSASFVNHRPDAADQPPWDRPRWRMLLTNKTAEGYKGSGEDMIRKIRGEGEDPSPTREVGLVSGVSARTWTQRYFFMEVVAEKRYIVFESPQKHVYRAVYSVPRDWKTRWRYDYLFWNILKSIEFKDSPGT